MLSYKWCICTLFALFPAFSSVAVENSKQIVSHTIVVDPSGGPFRTIQSAIDSVPANNQAWTRIDIKPGTYREQVRIPREKPFIYLKGAGQSNTFIVWDSLDADAVFSTQADNILAQDITYTNSHNINNNKPMGRAVAARIEGDKLAFHRCGFVSLQDTVWDVSGRHYFKECTITGAVDFIYGAGQSHYERCTISVSPLNGSPGFITAQGRGVPNDTSGFVFKSCDLVGRGKAFLGRPWRGYARVVFYNTQMADVVVPQGWDAWTSRGNERLLTMGEYNSRGPGARIGERVKWANKLSEQELEQFTNISFIDNQGWVNQALNILGP